MKEGEKERRLGETERGKRINRKVFFYRIYKYRRKDKMRQSF